MPIKFMEDNTATIQVIKHGHSKALRHLNRTHDVSLRWVKEVFDNTKGLTIGYIRSLFQAADIFTKAFAVAEKWAIARNLIGFGGLRPQVPDSIRMADPKTQGCCRGRRRRPGKAKET